MRRAQFGVGNKFMVRLPRLSSPQEETIETPKAAVTAARKLKVLVVDDNADAAQSVVMLLEVLGHHARMAQDGSAAMTMALDYVPDVVLLDIGLPKVDGLQVAQWIRRQSALKDVVLIAVTGYGEDSDRERTREAGFDEHLLKPVDFERVEGILSTVASTGSARFIHGERKES